MMAAGLPTSDCYSCVLTIALFSPGDFPSDRSYPPARFPLPLRCLHYSPQASDVPCCFMQGARLIGLLSPRAMLDSLRVTALMCILRPSGQQMYPDRLKFSRMDDGDRPR